MYYLQSRYYDPEVGRFVNADDLVSTDTENAIGANMFAYCKNNPVMLKDESGNLPEWATDLLIGVAVIAVVAVVAVATAGTGTVLACAAAGALEGAVTGAVSGAITGAATGAITHRMTTGTWEGAGTAALNGAASGFKSGAIIGAVTGALTSPYCFIAGTAIITAAGIVAIENISVGDKVYAWDEETGQTELKTVVETYENETTELTHVFACGEEIISTPSHPFYSPVKGWISACRLRAGDILVTVNGEYVVVEQVQHELIESPVKVYNFQVEDDHTYYVSGTGVLVHNMCSDDIYSSVKKSPNYNNDFVKVQNGTVKVNINNLKLLDELNQYGTGWKKVYSDGYIDGVKVSLHYFQDKAGQVFNVKFKIGWSVIFGG